MGLGYIGLPTAALIAKSGIKVIGVDVNADIVETVNRGDVHIKEPDLEGLVKYVVENGNLVAKKEPEEADVFIIAVPTPFKDGYKPDLSYVIKATEMIIPYLREVNLVIIESTSPVGTTERISELIFKKRPELEGKIFIAYCPERVLPGKILYELENNDRVIGGIDEKSTEKAVEFYSRFVKGGLHRTNAKTAEMCKLVENAYRDVNIAFANEISMICDKAGIDVRELIELANKHPRVNILQPGVGVGGHCIAVDPWFIISEFEEDSRLMRTAREVNMEKMEWVIEKIEESIREFRERYNKEPVVACLGLTYKPDVDDLRESPALKVVRALISKGYNIMPVDPNVESVDGLKLNDFDFAIRKADIVNVLVGHRKFLNIISIGKEKFNVFC